MIRPAVLSDVPTLVRSRLAQQLELYSVGDLDPDDRRRLEERLSGYFARACVDDDALFLVDEEGSAIAAVCGFSIEHQPPQIGDNGVYAYVCDAYTAPGFRRQGRMGRLVRAGTAEMRKRGVSALYFDSISESMIRLCQGLGFEHRHDYYSLIF